MSGQISLFSEAEIEADFSSTEPIIKDVRGYKCTNAKTKREELEYIPAKVQIVRYVHMFYECPICNHPDYPYIAKALTPTSLMNPSLASPSNIANVMRQKYINAVPLYRQEKDWETWV